MKSKAMNPVLDFINTLCNFVALNLVFLITCLPVITIGTALSSLYYVTLRERLAGNTVILCALI